MAECTEKERALIDACIEKGTFYGNEYDAVSAAVAAVGMERLTPERKARIAQIWREEKRLQRELSELSRGIPHAAWLALIEECYPKPEREP